MVMSKFNFAVLISGSGSNLQAMIDAIDNNMIDDKWTVDKPKK